MRKTLDTTADASIIVSGAEQQFGSGAWDSGNITISFGDSAGGAGLTDTK